MNPPRTDKIVQFRSYRWQIAWYGSQLRRLERLTVLRAEIDRLNLAVRAELIAAALSG